MASSAPGNNSPSQEGSLEGTGVDGCGIRSLLDTDTYKFTMQYAVFTYYRETIVEYKFTNRTPELKLNRLAFEWLQHQIESVSALQFEESELAFLHKHFPVFSDDYLQFLAKFRLDGRKQVQCTLDEEDNLHLLVKGKWVEVILWEVPLLALISQSYFMFVDTDWNHHGQMDKAREKARRLIDASCLFCEFGTRRRRDARTQEMVLHGILKAEPGKFLAGTSNVHFAKQFDLKPVGTVAHEWFMGIAAINNDYRHANKIAMQKWAELYGHLSGIALTDTFGTDAFLADFDRQLALQFAGVRHDSGSPEAFVAKLKHFYNSLQIPTRNKVIAFSDSLNVDRCVELQNLIEREDFKSFFGIGTFLTNDFQRTTGGPSTPLNIVIKLSKLGDVEAVKLSDEPTKNSGSASSVARVKSEVGYKD